MRYLPNFVSVLRILLVAPTAWFLWHNEIALALALMAVAGISDALDGALARRYNCLLYTSPSPRDSNLSRMPSSA